MVLNPKLKKETVTAEDIEKIVEILNQLKVGWSVGTEEINVKMFESGATSNIYHITFPPTAPPPSPLPPSLVIKIYPPASSLPYLKINSQINNLLVGQATPPLSPRVLLIRPDALVWEYVASSRALDPLLDDPDLVFRRDLARKLAQFHALNVPVIRNNHQEGIRYVFEVWLNQSWITDLRDPISQVHQVIVKLNCTTLLDPSKDLAGEMAFVRDRILALENPKIVYSHSDFNHSNILVQEAPDRSKELRFIDFDFSGYFYRGTDLGNYFFSCKQVETWDDNTLISDNEMRQFIEWYREAWRDLGQDLEETQDSVEAILVESKLFILYTAAVGIIFILFIIETKLKTGDEKGVEEFLIYLERLFRCYLRSKARFQADGSI